MKKVFAWLILSACMAAPSFAGDVVGHGAKVAGKDSAKVATVAGKDSAKVATVAVKNSAKAAKKAAKFLS